MTTKTLTKQDEDGLMTKLTESEHLEKKYELLQRQIKVLELIPDGTPAKKSTLDTHKMHFRETIANDALTQLEELTCETETANQRRKLLNMHDASSISTQICTELKPTNTLEKLIIDQCSSLHIVSMRLLAMASDDSLLPVDEGKIAKTSEKMLNAFNQKVDVLINLRNSSNNKPISTTNVQVNGGQNVVAGSTDSTTNPPP